MPAAAATPADRLRRLLDGALGAFRARDRYGKMQVALVGAWIAVSLVTVGAVAWSGPASDKLGAQVHTEPAIGGVVLLITNDSGSRWTDITYTLNGSYVYRQAALEPGEHLTVQVNRFRKGGSGGRRAPRDLQPKLLAIACEEGKTLVDLARSGTP